MTDLDMMIGYDYTNDSWLDNSVIMAEYYKRSHFLPNQAVLTWDTVSNEEIVTRLPGFKLIRYIFRDWSGHRGNYWIYENESKDAVVYVNHYVKTGNFRMAVAHTDQFDRDALVKTVQEIFVPSDKRIKNDDPSHVNYKFWYRTAHGPASFERSIEVPIWNDIQTNYTAAVRDHLDYMMNLDEWDRSGKLILWTGSPGTGKTYAIRALSSAWRHWANIYYITDPENFLSSDTQYLFEILGRSEETDLSLYDPELWSMPEGEIVEHRKTWNLLVFEDCGELLMADAKERVGQGLSRFLNTVDGLIGQGMNVVCLVTSNEEIKDLHEAVTRPGRCAHRIEFAALKRGEINEWYEKNAPDLDPSTSSATVAELYNGIKERGLRKSSGKEKKNNVGFA